MENYMGKVASAEEIIQFRDEKIEIIEDYLNKATNYNKKINAIATIASINPGPIKNNRMYKDITDYGLSLIRDLLNKKNIEIKEEIYLEKTGGITFLYKLLFKDIKEIYDLKKAFIEIEDNDKVGRLLDLDLIVKDKSVSRNDLLYEKRKCLLCDEIAHLCNRGRVHKMEDIINKINELYVNNF